MISGLLQIANLLQTLPHRQTEPARSILLPRSRRYPKPRSGRGVRLAHICTIQWFGRPNQPDLRDFLEYSRKFGSDRSYCCAAIVTTNVMTTVCVKSSRPFGPPTRPGTSP